MNCFMVILSVLVFNIFIFLSFPRGVRLINSTFLNSNFGKLMGEPVMASHERLERPAFSCGETSIKVKRVDRSHELLRGVINQQAVRVVNSFPDDIRFYCHFQFSLFPCYL